MDMITRREVESAEEELLAIHQALLAHPSYERGAGTLPDDPGHFDQRTSILDLIRRLNTVIATVERRMKAFAGQEQIAQRYPREERYRAQQSIRDRSAPFRKLYQRAFDLLDALRRLEAENGTANFFEALGQGLAQMMKPLPDAAELTGDGAAKTSAGKVELPPALLCKLEASGFKETVTSIRAADHYAQPINAQSNIAYNVPFNAVMGTIMLFAISMYLRRGGQFNA